MPTCKTMNGNIHTTNLQKAAVFKLVILKGEDKLDQR